MRCPRCFKKIDDDCDFCTHCGHKIEKEVICPNCGTVNGAAAKFCKKCGSPLAVNSKEENQVKETKVDRGFLLNLLGKISMGLALFSMVILFGLSFSPYLISYFYSNSDFTAIGWIVKVFQNGLGSLSKDQYYLTIVNCFLVLVLFSGMIIVDVIVIGKSIPKLIKGIKENSFYSFSKEIAIVLSLFLTFYIYFVHFVLNGDSYYSDGINGWMIAALSISALSFMFGKSIDGLKKESVNLIRLISKLSLQVIAIVFISFIVFNISGDRYYLNASMGTGQTNLYRTYRLHLNNIDAASFFIHSSLTMYEESREWLQKSIVLTSVSAFIEILVWIASMIVLYKTLTIDSKGKISFKLIIGCLAFIIAGWIAGLVLNQRANEVINFINSVAKYNASFRSEQMNINAMVIGLVFSSIALLFFVALTIALQIINKRVNNNEEN